MPFPTAVIFLLVLFATGLAALCVTVGLCLFVVREYKAVAPYITFVYPATYFGCALGVAAAWRLNALVQHHSESLGAVVLVFVVCFVGGAATGGFLGYVLASRVAKRLVRGCHFKRTTLTQ